MRLVGVQYRRIEIAPPFGIGFGIVEGRAQFHFIARGPVFLRASGGALQALGTGDAVLLPRGGAHELLSAPDLPSRDIASFETAPLCKTVGAIRAVPDESGGAAGVLVFSGCMEFDLGGMHPLVALMPEVMMVGTLLDRYPEILPMLEAMAREACTARAGFAAILARMGSSRSVFAERFLAVTGLTPLRYLADLRMRLAAQWIGRDRMPIEAAAHRLGYGSQAAFSRAFKRVIGQSPGAVRTKAPAGAGHAA